MISKKYASDYRMDTEPDKSGKLKNKMVYTGPLYEWSCKPEELKRLRISYLFAGLGIWILLIGMLAINNYFAHLWYIIVPCACCILSFGYFSVAVLYLYRVQSPFNREMKEKQYDRIKGTITGSLILLLTSMSGQVITAIRFMEGLTFKDILFSLGNIILIGTCLWILKSSKILTVSEVENPMTKIWAEK